MKKLYITIKKGDDGERLDKLIPIHLTNISRGKARKLIAAGSVSINGKRVKNNSRKVISGQTIAIYLTNSDPEIHQIEDPVILHEDRWYVVVVKASGMPADETLLGWKGTLSDVLTRKFNYKYLQIVHRLDMGTSGVMVLSKTPAATKILNQQFRERTISKQYVALIHGRLDKSDGTIITHL
ncbi:RluA family pseudouridine synthase, partial [bacterium]|nr:RluA family pseudouridine synthase [bacterium]